jgi:hypothetical protein
LPVDQCSRRSGHHRLNPIGTPFIFPAHGAVVGAGGTGMTDSPGRIDKGV